MINPAALRMSKRFNIPLEDPRVLGFAVVLEELTRDEAARMARAVWIHIKMRASKYDSRSLAQTQIDMGLVTPNGFPLFDLRGQHDRDGCPVELGPSMPWDELRAKFA